MERSSAISGTSVVVRLISILCFVSTAVVMFYALRELRVVGFPDGALTEWDEWRQVILSLVAAVSFVSAGWYLYCAISKRRRVAFTRVAVVALIYIALLLYAYVLDGGYSELSGLGG